jgi:hypothetical protein
MTRCGSGRSLDEQLSFKVQCSRFQPPTLNIEPLNLELQISVRALEGSLSIALMHERSALEQLRGN